jgi:hypothetical protein
VVLYPATASAKEWADELLQLDQLVVEGFGATELRAIAGKLATSTEPDWGSLRIIEAILVGLGAPSYEARSVVKPLRALHNLRTKVRGHSSSDQRRKLERAALSEFSTFRGHFKALARDCDSALSRIIAALDTLD